MFHRNHTLRTAAGIAVVAVALALTACSPAAPDDTASGSTTADVDPAEALRAAYDGVLGTPPTETVPITEGQSVWIVSCGELALTCSTPAAGAKEAADEIGWDANVCDGLINPDGWAACVRQGIAAAADVIVTVGIDCPAINGAMLEASDAGIITVNIGGVDCDPGLFSTSLEMLDGVAYEDYWKLFGKLQADWLIGKTDGAAVLLDVQFNDTLWGPLINQGLKERLAECSGCSVAGSVQLSSADLGAGTLAQKFSTALLQHPDVNAVAIPIDAWFLAGLAQAISASGRSDDLNVIGVFGSIPNTEIIRADGGQDATVGNSAEWTGWAAIDAALRVLADQDAVPAGVGAQVMDIDTNLPGPGQAFAFEPAVDFRAAYLAIWEK